jgi:hypothetical protein
LEPFGEVNIGLLGVVVPEEEVEPDELVDPDVDPVELPLGTVVVELVDLATLAQTWFDGLETPAGL